MEGNTFVSGTLWWPGRQLAGANAQGANGGGGPRVVRHGPAHEEGPCC